MSARPFGILSFEALRDFWRFPTASVINYEVAPMVDGVHSLAILCFCILAGVPARVMTWDLFPVTINRRNTESQT
jgi:hypothetical protein